MNDTRLREDVEPALRAAQGSKMRYIRLGALIVFALITSYGLYLLFRGNWREVAAYWFARRRLLALAFCLSACDIFTDACIWQGILRQFGIRPGVRRGVLLFLSGYAGHLMPAQLGRFFRASEVARLGHGDFKTVAKVEIILLYFVIITSISVFTGAFLYRLWGVPAVVAPVCMIVAAMIATHIGIRWIPRLASLFPTGYWLRPATVLLALAAAIGWLFNGAILYLIFKDVAENLAYTQTIMIMTSNLFIGVMSGLPGGLGLTDSYIGAMMYWLKTPPEHLVMAVAAFRIITFALWIPIGWTAVLLISMLFRSTPDAR